MMNTLISSTPAAFSHSRDFGCFCPNLISSTLFIRTTFESLPVVVRPSMLLFSQENDASIESDLNFSIETFRQRTSSTPLKKNLRRKINQQRKKSLHRSFIPQKISPKSHSPKLKKEALNGKFTQESNQSLSDSIDSFLAGDYAHPFSPDAAAPHPGLTPGETVDVSLRALRQLNEPYSNHGAAVFLRFCLPLTRGERWGGNDPWKELLRGALTPSMLARKLRGSPLFSCLLDWSSLDVTEGTSNPYPSVYSMAGNQSDVTYVNAGLFFEGGAPSIVHFVLKKIGAAWFIDMILIGGENGENVTFCPNDGLQYDGYDTGNEVRELL